jgi:DNA polymerase III subunit epsilon
MNFVAIDFETANERRHSACEIGVSVVRDNQLVETKAWLIRPPEVRFNSFNTYLHGIAAHHVINEPEFNELWKILEPYLNGQLVIAHNASFDLSVLRCLLDYYALPYPELTYSCSLMMARNAWQGLPSYRLNALSELLDIPLNHHRALSDAIACSHLALKAFRRHEVDEMEEIEEKMGLKTGRLFLGGYVACTKVKANYSRSARNR